MKKFISLVIISLIIQTLFLPIVKIVCSVFGFVFILNFMSVFAVIIAITSLLAVVLSAIHKLTIESKLLSCLLAIISFITMINSVVYALSDEGIIVVASMIVSFICSLILTVMLGKPKGVKWFSFIVSCLLIYPFSLIMFLSVLLKDFGYIEVVKSLESPNGKYVAEVLDDNQGALGGSTIVQVVEDKGFDAFIFKIEKAPQEIYFGDWGEFEDMEIFWIDNETLVVNKKEYLIK